MCIRSLKFACLSLFFSLVLLHLTIYCMRLEMLPQFQWNSLTLKASWGRENQYRNSRIGTGAMKTRKQYMLIMAIELPLQDASIEMHHGLKKILGKYFLICTYCFLCILYSTPTRASVRLLAFLDSPFPNTYLCDNVPSIIINLRIQ